MSCMFRWYTCVCFFKQKTAYEMRISDWSSDVCSSDLATRERTEEAVRQVKGFYNQQEVVTSVFVVRGFSFFGQGQANGMMFTMLKPWEERSGEENSSLTLVGTAMGFFASIKEAMVFALNPPDRKSVA